MAERQRALRRQQKAREAAQEVLVKRRAAFSAQQDALKKRLDDLERKRAADEVRMRLEAERNAERRMAAIAEAKREEEKRIEAIVAKKRRQDERLAAAYDKRKFEAAQKNAQRTIKQSLRTSKVEAMQRASEYSAPLRSPAGKSSALTTCSSSALPCKTGGACRTSRLTCRRPRCAICSTASPLLSRGRTSRRYRRGHVHGGAREAVTKKKGSAGTL